MELTLNNIAMEGYACLLDTTVFQEETQESIVPDACPDIGRVLCTEARACLRSKESVEGKVEGEGNIAVTVVYLPDGEEGPRKLCLTIPFRVSVAAAGVTPGCPVVVMPRVTAAETRVLNPRKVLCRVELAVACQGWGSPEETLTAPWTGEECALEQRTEMVEHYAAMSVTEKAFAFTDDVALTAGQNVIAELLGHRLDLRCDEAKVIGNKLIFKGEVTLQARYRTVENALAMGRWELPFSQIMDVGGIEEEGACVLDIVEQDSHVETVDDGEGRTLAVHLELLAQAVVRQTRTVEVFSDAYSVSQNVEVERREMTFAQLWEENAVNQIHRELFEVSSPVRSVEDCWVVLGQPTVERRENEGAAAVQGTVTILYLTEEGMLDALTRPIRITATLALPEKGDCRVRCATGGEAGAVATAGGIELRCPVRFSYLTTVPRKCSAVTAIRVEERPEGEERPSVILRLAQPGESLWDIAKSYSTTTRDILAANELPDPDHPEGTLLLIPRSR